MLMSAVAAALTLVLRTVLTVTEISRAAVPAATDWAVMASLVKVTLIL